MYMYYFTLLQELKEIESKIFVDSEPEFGIPEVIMVLPLFQTL